MRFGVGKLVWFDLFFFDDVSILFSIKTPTCFVIFGERRHKAFVGSDTRPVVIFIKRGFCIP